MLSGIKYRMRIAGKFHIYESLLVLRSILFQYLLNHLLEIYILLSNPNKVLFLGIRLFCVNKLAFQKLLSCLSWWFISLDRIWDSLPFKKTFFPSQKTGKKERLFLFSPFTVNDVHGVNRDGGIMPFSMSRINDIAHKISRRDTRQQREILLGSHE